MEANSAHREALWPPLVKKRPRIRCLDVRLSPSGKLPIVSGDVWLLCELTPLYLFIPRKWMHGTLPGHLLSTIWMGSNWFTSSDLRWATPSGALALTRDRFPVLMQNLRAHAILLRCLPQRFTLVTQHLSWYFGAGVWVYQDCGLAALSRHRDRPPRRGRRYVCIGHCEGTYAFHLSLASMRLGVDVAGPRYAE